MTFDCATVGLACDLQANSGFGAALTSGDFNGDGRYDLAIGMEYYDFPNASNAGAVQVIYGGPNGLAPLTGFAPQH